MSHSTQSQSAGLADVPGFLLSAASADVRGLKNNRLDLALIRNTGPEYTAAAVFTRNDIKAAPVRQGMVTLDSNGGRLQAILVNSGNANACTGPEGLEDNCRLMEATAQSLGIDADDVLISSTGRIGRRLPLDRMVAAIPGLAENLDHNPENGRQASEAILTSDTRPKTVTVTVEIGGRQITIAGMAKGAGMIQPDMATMLAFIATDASLEPGQARELLRDCTAGTFNSITVDGDMSTNDTVALLANGHSGVCIEKENTGTFREALHSVCARLAAAIAGDGEKVSHVVELLIEGAPDSEAADKVARAIGNSLLVKTSWYGTDPNWGRLIDAAGYAMVGIDESVLDLYYGDTPVFIQGREQAEYRDQWKAIVSRRLFSIRLNLNLGQGSARLLTTDLTEAYVNFNKSE